MSTIPSIHTVQVAAERPYQVRIGSGVRAELPALAVGASRVAIIHPGLLAGPARELAADLEAEVVLLEVPEAEAAKTPEVLVDCWQQLSAAGFTRSDLVVGLGGGATTDLAGFVAATLLRGIDFVSVPTTVLGMVDAAVGGKTGINVAAGKNLVGAFWEPRGVLCDPDLLSGLPAADVAAGLAEVVKCGFVADPEILALVEADPHGALAIASPTQTELVRRAIEVKAAVVSADLRESTSSGTRIGRELVNYGHTFGHAIEQAEHYTWRHGDAVAVGMVYVAELAHLLGELSTADRDRHRRVLEMLGLPSGYRGDWSALRAAMGRDKKARGATLRFIGLQGIAAPVVIEAPSEELLEAAYRRVAG